MPEPKSPYKRVRRHFSQQKLKQVCEMHETDFYEAYDMEFELVAQPAPSNYYLFKDNGSSILAVAHLDTVMDHERRGARFVTTEAGPVVYSGALDDRLGAYTILELLPSLGINYDILLTVGEESGMSTAQFFTPPKDKEYHWMIEFDRGGTDVVLYQYEDREMKDLVKETGAVVGNGIFSDISYMSHLEIKGINWGVGYRDYHGPRSHAYLEDYWMMIGHFIKFHDANKDVYLPHDGKNDWGMGGRWGSSWGSSSWRDYDYGSKDDTVEAELRELTDSDDAYAFEPGPWENDANWGEEEWDAYIDGGIEAVRVMYEENHGIVRDILDDDGDIVSDDYEDVQRVLENEESSSKVLELPSGQPGRSIN